MGIQFDNIPAELRSRDYWLLWRSEQSRKVPYQPHKPTRRAKSTDPATWATFDATKAAYKPRRDAGVGFVLDGGGCAAIDIDGDVSKRAIDLLHDAGCQYIEYSPSGNGLHGWGYLSGNLRRKKGAIDGISVEVYSTGRYMSVTGNAIVAGSLQELNDVSKSLNAAGVTQETQETHEVQESQVRGVLQSQCGEIELQRFIPQTVRQRNKALFKLARHIKAKIPQVERQELRVIIRQWHELALPTIGTQDFLESWGDFIRGWEQVKFPEGAFLDALLDGVADDPLPNGVPDDYGETPQLLAKICQRLQANAGDEPFFLSSRKAGELVGVSPMQAWRLLKGLAADDTLELVELGTTGTHAAKASQYRFIG